MAHVDRRVAHVDCRIMNGASRSPRGACRLPRGACRYSRDTCPSIRGARRSSRGACRSSYVECHVRRPLGPPQKIHFLVMSNCLIVVGHRFLHPKMVTAPVSTHCFSHCCMPLLSVQIAHISAMLQIRVLSREYILGGVYLVAGGRA